MNAVLERWPAELGAPDWVHPRWCRRVAGCESGHRSATYAVGPVLVYATATGTWATTVHTVGETPTSEVGVLRLRLLSRYLADPAGVR